MVGLLGKDVLDLMTFETRLHTAAQRAVRFAREYVRQTLPDQVAFLIYPNQSHDGNPRVGDEVIFPEEGEQRRGPWSAEQVVAFLWRDGKVPEWINIAVESEDGKRTLVGLRCCGRFTAREELLYHRYPDGVPPFSIKSPFLPPRWENLELSGKFDLHWQRTLISKRWVGRPIRWAWPFGK